MFTILYVLFIMNNIYVVGQCRVIFSNMVFYKTRAIYTLNNRYLHLK